MGNRHHDRPTVYDQIRALYGVGDVVRLVSSAASEECRSSLEMAAASILLATKALEATLSSEEQDRLTCGGGGFPSPYGAIPDDSTPLTSGASISVSN